MPILGAARWVDPRTAYRRNQASIVNYGAADRFAEMSEAYRKACESLKDGNGNLSDILSDSAFAGMGA